MSGIVSFYWNKFVLLSSRVKIIRLYRSGARAEEAGGSYMDSESLVRELRHEGVESVFHYIDTSLSCLLTGRRTRIT